MESVIPASGDLARSAMSASLFQDDLKAGTWTYPKSLAFGDMNLSVYFDFILLVGLVITWVFQVIFSANDKDDKSVDHTREDKMKSIKDKCLMGEKKGAFPLTTGVAFVTKDEYSLFLSTAIMMTFVFFKIICGAEGVTAGYLYIIALLALFARFVKQGGKDRVWMMFTTVLAVSGISLAFLAYTETIPGKKTGEKSGQNITYIFSGVLLLLAGALKIIMTLNARESFGGAVDGNGKPASYDKYLNERAAAIVDGDWLYELTGVSVIVNSACIMTFVFSEMITIALAATKWYAVPFYALYPMAIYNIGAVLNSATCSKNVSFGPLAYNLVMSFLGVFILLLLQGHACSLPSSTVGEFATGEHPYCPRFGGLKRSTADGLKIYKGWTITLEILVALFLLMAYWSMVFTSRVTKKTVRYLCGVDSEKYIATKV